MAIRHRALPPGWYPEDEEEILELLVGWTSVGSRQASAESALVTPGGAIAASHGAIAVVAPHAGWSFSGRLAARAIASLREADTAVIIGGHLPNGAPPLVGLEDGFETPLGIIAADRELREALAAALGRTTRLERDLDSDNTVEVQLSIVKWRFPDSRLLWLRAPNGPASLLVGRALHAAATTLGRRIACVGSTDLTHYGPMYGFSPKGKGPSAERWVREINDRAYIDALLALDPDGALDRAVKDRSACSPGAASAAAAFALAAGATNAELLEYATSLDVHEAASFVGYAAIGFFA